MGISLRADWFEPNTSTDPSDIEATNKEMEHCFGWFAHPIFVNGDYSQLLRSMLKKKNKTIPKFTDYESTLIKG